MLDVGQKAPDFALIGIDDKTYSLSDLLASNKVVAVIFSCNHCPYVLAWEDRMIDIQRDYADQKVALVAINPNDARKYPEDDFPKMKTHAKQKGFNFPYLRDESQDIARAYGATHTPHVFLLDADGIVRYRGAIDDNYDNPGAVKHSYLRNALDAVLAGKDPETATSSAVGCTIKWK
jgi:peroxiredoxin